MSALGQPNVTARVPGRFVPRVCPVCGEVKPPRAFQTKRHRGLNITCAECVVGRKEQVKRIFASDSRLRENRRRAVGVLVERARRRRARGKEVSTLNEAEYVNKVAKLPDRIAAIVGKTYAEAGDAATLADDEGMMMIRDLLLELGDETLIARNKHKRLARGRS